MLESLLDHQDLKKNYEDMSEKVRELERDNLEMRN